MVGAVLSATGAGAGGAASVAAGVSLTTGWALAGMFHGFFLGGEGGAFPSVPDSSASERDSMAGGAVTLGAWFHGFLAGGAKLGLKCSKLGLSFEASAPTE